MKFQVKFHNWIEPEDMPIEGNVLASGDDREDREQERWVMDQLNSGNTAAWCMAGVTAAVEVGKKTFVGRAGLGGCSYESERRLWEDLFDDMHDEALEDLFRQMREFAGEANQVLVALDQLLEDTKLPKRGVRWDPGYRR